MTCSRCGGERDRQGQRYCRKCHAAQMRAYRARKNASRVTTERVLAELTAGIAALVSEVRPSVGQLHGAGVATGGVRNRAVAAKKR